MKNNENWIRFKAHYFTVSYVGLLLWKIVRFVILLGLCYIILYPFFMKIINAFKGVEDFLDPTVRFIPKAFFTQNIKRVMDSMDYFNTLRNTAIIAVITAVSQTIVSATVGYGFAWFKFRFNKLLFFMVILSLIVPPQTIIIPLYLKFRFFAGFINLIDTPFPIIILSLTGFGIKNALYIFLFRQFFKNMPKELEEASYLDGCGAFRTFIKIMLPSASSILITVLLLSFSWQWTDTLYSSLFLDEFRLLPNLIGSVGFGELPIIASNYVNIAALLSIIPVAFVYVFAQKYFIQSIDRSGLVG